jgi:hypothetical protein
MRLAGIDDVDVNAVHPVSLFLVIFGYFWQFLAIFGNGLYGQLD